MNTSHIGLLIVILGMLALGGVMLWSHMHRKRIRAQRDGHDLEMFVAEFGDTHVSRVVLQMVYEDLSTNAKLPVHRFDDLEKTHGFLPEVITDVIENRCRTLGVADVWKSSYASLLPLRTAEDYVRLLAAIRGESPAIESRTD